MKSGIIKMAINAIAILIVFFYATRKNRHISDEIETVYDITVPGLLTGLCVFFLVFGVIFSTTMIIASKSTDTVTNGHYYIGLTMILIGVFGFIACMNWKVSVSEKYISYTNVFGMTSKYSKDEIVDVFIGKKDELTIIFTTGKIVIDPSTTNYSLVFGELIGEQ